MASDLGPAPRTRAVVQNATFRYQSPYESSTFRSEDLHVTRDTARGRTKTGRTKTGRTKTDRTESRRTAQSQDGPHRDRYQGRTRRSGTPMYTCQDPYTPVRTLIHLSGPVRYLSGPVRRLRRPWYHTAEYPMAAAKRVNTGVHRSLTGLYRGLTGLVTRGLMALGPTPGGLNLKYRTVKLGIH